MIKWLSCVVVIVSLLYGQVNAEELAKTEVTLVESGEIQDTVLNYLDSTAWDYCVPKQTQTKLDLYPDKTVDEIESYTCGYRIGLFLKDHPEIKYSFDKVSMWFLDKWVGMNRLQNLSIQEYRTGYFDIVKGLSSKYE